MIKPLSDDTMAVQITVGQLRAIVTEAVDQAVRSRGDAPALLSLRSLAEKLGVSERMILDLRKDGLPTVMIGDSPKFDLPEVIDWLRLRDAREIIAALAEVEPMPAGPIDDPSVGAALRERMAAVAPLVKPGQSVDLGNGITFARTKPKKKGAQ